MVRVRVRVRVRHFGKMMPCVLCFVFCVCVFLVSVSYVVVQVMFIPVLNTCTVIMNYESNGQ